MGHAGLSRGRRPAWSAPGACPVLRAGGCFWVGAAFSVWRRAPGGRAPGGRAAVYGADVAPCGRAPGGRARCGHAPCGRAPCAVRPWGAPGCVRRQWASPCCGGQRESQILVGLTRPYAVLQIPRQRVIASGGEAEACCVDMRSRGVLRREVKQRPVGSGGEAEGCCVNMRSRGVLRQHVKHGIGGGKG